MVDEPAVYEPVVDEKWEESVRLTYRNAMVKESAKEWDVGICEWTGSRDEEGWPQNLNWGHESKYGNKRFGKRFWKEMDECGGVRRSAVELKGDRVVLDGV